MRVVYKYAVPVSAGRRHPISVSTDARLLHVAEQHGEPTLWLETDPYEVQETREFQVIGTGWQVPEQTAYVGTAHCGAFVWHVYEVAR